MTGNRILYFYALLISFALFVLLDAYLFHLLFLFLLILPVVSLLAALPVSRKLRYRLNVEDDIQPKGDCPAELTVQNVSSFPCACVRVILTRKNLLGRVGDRYSEDLEDTIYFSVEPKRTKSVQPPLQMEHCGRVDLGVRRIAVCDMLGLFRLPVPKGNAGPVSGSVYVLPELQSRSIQTEEAADLGLDSATYSTKKPGNDPSEIFQLRDYREGDARHSVHWKLSSRMGRLIVREFGLPLNPCLHFLLELRENASHAAAEQMLGAVFAYSEYLMAKNVTHSISYLGEEGALSTAFIVGPESLALVMHELLALPGTKPWSTLEHFALQTQHQADTHLVYLVAGAVWGGANDAPAYRVLESLPALNICRRLTLMPDRCSDDTAKELLSLGCEVQLLDGRIPNLETEEEA